MQDGQEFEMVNGGKVKLLKRMGKHICKWF